MKGGIFSDQRCPICGGSFKDDGKRGLVCQAHPQCQATAMSVRFKNVHKRFNSYEEATRFLTGLRFEEDSGKFDPRDYQKDYPLGFITLAEDYLEHRKGEIASYRQLKYYLMKGMEFFQHRNIKTIGYAELEDFLLVKTDRAKELIGHLKSKSRANIKATLHAFWVWLRKRKIIRLDQFPEFPEVPFELGWRKVIDKETQEAIINEVYNLTKVRNLKIWLGIKWLATYFSIRPKEMLNIKEGDIDYSLNGVWIRRPKERKPKFIAFLKEDMELAKSFPRGLPELYFFRHTKSYGGIKPGSKMGRNCLWKAWKKACANLGIEGVDLYGGCKHSSITDLKKYFTPEEIKRASHISTNKAFDRYFQIQNEDSRKIYQQSSGKVLVKNLGVFERGQLIDITSKT